MEEKQLYLKRIGDGYEVIFDLQPFDVDLMTDEYFLFKEAALVMLYPDGTMEAMRSSEAARHNVYYRKLYEKSKRFKEAVDSLGFKIDFEPDESTYRLDSLFSSLGISSLHNDDIPNIPFRLEDLEGFNAIFYGFNAEQTTDEVEKNLGVIYDNFLDGSIIRTRYNSKTAKFERENKEEIRRM